MKEGKDGGFPLFQIWAAPLNFNSNPINLTLAKPSSSTSIQVLNHDLPPRAHSDFSLQSLANPKHVWTR